MQLEKIPFLQCLGMAEETIPPGSSSAAGTFHIVLLRPLQLLQTVAGVQDGHAGGLCHHAVHQHAARTHPSQGKVSKLFKANKQSCETHRKLSFFYRSMYLSNEYLYIIGPWWWAVQRTLGTSVCLCFNVERRCPTWAGRQEKDGGLAQREQRLLS